MEYRIGNAVVRIHGEVNRERLKASTERFLKQVIAARAAGKELKDE